MEKSAIILAGGEGKRMMSEKPKTLSLILGKPMLQWVINSLNKASINNICIITGYKKEMIEEYIKENSIKAETAFQAERLGTGHAVMMAKDFLKANPGDVIILNGDAPFMDSKTIEEAYEHHKNTNSAATVISAVINDPTGYGRIIRKENNELLKIVEQKDASSDELKVCEVNSGAFWFDTEKLLSVLDDIKANNNAKEYYLPDALKLLINNNKTVSAFTAQSPNTVLGANDLKQLEELNHIAKTLI